MTYANFDDKFPEHPKIVGLSDGAFRLHTSAILYCSRHMTDGIVTAAALPLLVPRYKRSQLDELTSRLLWAILAGGAAYEIHGYLDWNRSRAEIDSLRETGRQAARKRWHKDG